MAPKRGASSQSLPGSDSSHDDAASVASSTLDAEEMLHRFFKKRKTNNSDSIEATRSSLELANFASIFSYMQGKLDAQALCLQFIKDGKFHADKKKQKQDEQDPKAASSTNKFHMLSIENWSDILTQIGPTIFTKDVCPIGHQKVVVQCRLLDRWDSERERLAES